MTLTTFEHQQSGVLPVVQSKNEIKAFYNKIARTYDLLAERSEQPMRDKGIALLDPGPGECILEIGCGTGHNLVRLAREVGPTGHVVGIDIAENMVALARQLLESEHLDDRAVVECGDAESLPYETETIDGILMTFTLELFAVADMDVVLSECYRVLRPGGRLVVVGISKEGRQGFLIKTFEWTHRHFPNLMDCRPIFVRRAVEEAGFAVEKAVVDRMWVPVEIVRGRKGGLPDSP